MVTEKTPPHKRIARAEKGREEWKAKAVERREENQRLNKENKMKDLRIRELKEEISDLKTMLNVANDKISRRDDKIEKLKKKSPKRK